MSNLQFTSKLTEKAVTVQLQEQMLVNGLFPELQSAYRQHHNTETALICLVNDIQHAIDDQWNSFFFVSLNSFFAIKGAF